MGRFMSHDWDTEAEPVPYADFDNPQSLNLYSYVTNNPLSRSDGDGHVPCGGTASITINVNSNGTSSMSQSGDDCPTMGWWDSFVWRWHQRILQHQPPPQPNSKGQALQDVNNIMMGAVPVGAVALRAARLRKLFGTAGENAIKGNAEAQARAALQRLEETKEVPDGLTPEDIDWYRNEVMPKAEASPNNPNTDLQKVRGQILDEAEKIIDKK